MTNPVALLVLGLWSACAVAALPPGFGDAPETLRVKVVTFGPGKEAHELFGHTALWVEDARVGSGFIYSHGMTAHSDGPPLAFLVRRQTFWAARLSVENTLAGYRRHDRAIQVQELRLAPEARRRLLSRLERDVSPAHRDYAYHPTDNNCATRVRDALDEALGGALREAATGPAGATWREHLRQSTARNPTVNLLLLTWVNGAMDTAHDRWEEAFMPVPLSRLLDTVTVPDGTGRQVGLVKERSDLHVPRAPPAEGQPLARLLLLGLAVALGAGGAGARRTGRGGRVLFGMYHAAFGLVAGSVGALGLGLMLHSEHAAVRGNVNVLLFNPLALTLVPLGIAMALGASRAERLARSCVTLLAACAVLATALMPLITQDLREPVALMLVATLGLAGAWRLPTRQPFAATAVPRRA
jgi:hypothetical protein